MCSWASLPAGVERRSTPCGGTRAEKRVTVLEPGGRSAPMHTETTTAIDPTTTTHAPIAFPDGEFRLFCASFGSAYGDARKVFRVRVDRDPHERAAEKGIRGYDRIVAVLDPELSGPTAATPASVRSSATRWSSSSCAGRRCSGSAVLARLCAEA